MQSCRPSPSLRHLHKLRFCRIRMSQRGIASATSANPLIYDVVCVGGGPAGLSLLNALRSNRPTSNLKIGLVEAQDLSNASKYDPPPRVYSNRCSSLTPASVGFLEDIGAWHHIKHSRVQPYTAMNVWDGVTGSSINFDWASASGLAPEMPSSGGQTIAYITENSNLTSALVTRATELGGISFFDRTRVEDISLGEDSASAVEADGLDLRSWPMVKLSTGGTLAARLLIGADGFNSPVREFAGIHSRGWDYERHGVVATLRLTEPLPNALATAYQRFLPTGPAALLPLPGPFATLVWTTLPQHAAHLKSLPPADLAAFINAAFRLSPTDIAYMHTLPSGQADELAWRSPKTPFDRALVPAAVEEVLPSSVASFPLRMRHVDTYTGERVALLGDAAHTIHPLAGQGLNQGQGDAEALAGVLAEACEGGMDVGSALTLEGYNARRWGWNAALLGVCDALHKVYSVDSGPLVGLRSLGLKAVNGMGFVKGALMRAAAGR